MSNKTFTFLNVANSIGYVRTERVRTLLCQFVWTLFFCFLFRKSWCSMWHRWECHMIDGCDVPVLPHLVAIDIRSIVSCQPSACTMSRCGRSKHLSSESFNLIRLQRCIAPTINIFWWRSCVTLRDLLNLHRANALQQCQTQLFLFRFSVRSVSFESFSD